MTNNAFKLSAVATRPSHLIRVIEPRLNKQNTIAGYLEQIPTRNYNLVWAEVTETRVMAVREWNEFVTNLLENRDWLAGKGGCGNWDPQYDGMSYIQISNMSKDRLNEYRATSYSLVIAVVSECTGQTIYIDPQGHDYARYVAFPATETTPEGKTRAELEKDAAAIRMAERKAEIARQIAVPPVVPADHGLKFYWNGIKVNGGKLEKAHYTYGNVYDYPDDTLSIGALEYHRFSAAISKCFIVTNNSDSQSDYFDKDRIRVCSNHPLYALVLEAYQAQERHEVKRREKKNAKK